MLFISVFYGTEAAYKKRIYLNLLILSEYKLKQSGNNVEISSCCYHADDKEKKLNSYCERYVIYFIFFNGREKA